MTVAKPTTPDLPIVEVGVPVGYVLLALIVGAVIGAGVLIIYGNMIADRSEG